MTPVARLAAAEANAAAARERLSRTLTDIQSRLEPRRLARDAANEARVAGAAGIDAARNNPQAVVGAVAVTGLLLTRHRILRLFRRKPKPVPAQARATPATIEGPSA
jgi:hypothetical protein